MPRDDAPSFAGLRVLVVEDDYLIALDMTELVQSLGAIAIGPAGTVPDALALVEAEGGTLDYAFLDLDLRGRPTYAIADALAARGVPFTFLTGFSADAIAAGYRGYPRLEKPIDTRMLVGALNRRG